MFLINLQNASCFQQASPGGTQWWHSHSNLQRKDGMFGALIVKQAPERDIHSDLYDYDLPEHVVFITDWTHTPTISSFAGQISPFAVGSILINGKGSFKEFSNGNRTVFTPREVFKVDQGKRYRFRLIGNNVCHHIITVQSHKLKVIATDAFPVEPVEVNRIGIGSGERFDFVLTADQEVGNYWVRVSSEDPACVVPGVPNEFAILRYEGAPNEEPGESFSTILDNGLFLNPAPLAEGSAPDVDLLLRTSNLNSTGERSSTVFNILCFVCFVLFHSKHQFALFSHIILCHYKLQSLTKLVGTKSENRSFVMP